MMTDLNTKLKRDEGLRRAALHFAEDFIIGLREADKGLYHVNALIVQDFAKRNFGHELNVEQITGLVILIQGGGRLHKDNQQIFTIASFMCDILDDSKDIGGRRKV